MSDLDQLYQNIILDHNKRPRNYGALPDATHRAEGYNALCGDRVEVFLKIADDRIEAIQFEAASCAICQASASIMTEELVGQDARRRRGPFRKRSKDLLGDGAENEQSERELTALQGVRKFPSRIKCATLPWETLSKAYLDAAEGSRFGSFLTILRSVSFSEPSSKLRSSIASSAA